jgi:hypothetical protein
MTVLLVSRDLFIPTRKISQLYIPAMLRTSLLAQPGCFISARRMPRAIQMDLCFGKWQCQEVIRSGV